jgi:apolipoprotein N-acyltransferase
MLRTCLKVRLYTLFPLPVMTPLYRALLLILSGLLLGIGYAPLHLGALAYVGFIPLLLVLEDLHSRQPKRLQTLRALYLTFFVFHGISNWWVSSWQREADPYLIAAGVTLWVFHPFFFAIPLLAYMLVRRRVGRGAALAALPFFWTAFEWLHSLGELSYPWQALGYTQAFYTPVIQIADATGVWGISFVIVAANSLIAHIFLTLLETQTANTDKPRVVQLLKTVRQCRVQLIALLGMELAVLGYGVLRVVEFRHPRLLANSETVAVGIVQPNVNPWGKWQGSTQDQVLIHIALQDSLRKALQQTTSTSVPQRLDLVLWSETAIPYRVLLPQNYLYLKALSAWTDSTRTAILSGCPTDKMYARKADAPVTAAAIPRMFDTVYTESFNSAMLLAPNADILPDTASTLPTAPATTLQRPYPNGVPIYRKMKLTPFAERVPYADAFSFAVKALTWSVGISGWGLGKSQETLDLVRFVDTARTLPHDTVRIGTVICIESIYPAFVSAFVRKGANVLVVITNDGWFNYTPGPEQHYMIAAVRAVETRRYIARCGNTGISGFITPLGTSLQRTEIDTQTALAARLPLLTVQSPYVQYEDWFAVSVCAASLVFLWLGVRPKKT